jgi:hypothetical protein
MTDYESLLSRIDKLNSIGIALSAETNPLTLQEKILHEAHEITHADGGTLYLLKEDNKLHFEIMHTRSLGLHYGGSTGKRIPLPLLLSTMKTMPPITRLLPPTPLSLAISQYPRHKGHCYF